MSRQFEDYRGYSIVHNKTGARILAGDGTLAHPDTFDDLDAAKLWVDTRFGDLQGDRREGHIGTVEGYKEMLATQELSKHEHVMLTAHRAAEGRRLTAQQLADVAGWKRYSSANLHYGRLGKRITEQLGLDIREDSSHAYTHAIGEYDEATSEWVMHEELAQAMDEMTDA